MAEQGDGAGQPDYMVIGDTLDRIRDEMNDKFVSLAQNMEQQLVDLRQQLEAEKKVTADLRRQLKNSQEQCEEFKQECSEKSHDLNQINDFYQSNADASAFQKLCADVVERHQALAEQLQNIEYGGDVGPMNKAWQDEIYKIVQHIQGSANASEQAAIVDELKNRTRELENIQKVMNGEQPASVLEDLADQCEERHAAQQGDPMSTYQAPGKIEDANALQDNKDWEALLREFVASPPKGGDDGMQQRNELYLQELGDRIGDLQQVKDILDRKKDENVAQEDVQEQARNLLLAVQQRHTDTESRVQDTVNNNNNDDVQRLNALRDNDTNWRRELGGMVSQVVEHEEEPEEQWWLDKDDKRRKAYDAILTEQHEQDTLMKDAVYLNRELRDEIQEEKTPYTPLYIPIEPINKHRVLGTLYDAGEVCDFLAVVNPEMIDKRAVHRPANTEDPIPLTDKQVWENACLLLSSCKAMALQLPSYQPHAWCNPKHHAPVLIAVLNGLAKERLKNYVNIEKHPEIIRLLTTNELNDDPEKVRHNMTPSEVLKRWMNLTLGRPMNTEMGNMAVDLYNTLRQIDSQFAAQSPTLNNGIMNKGAADKLLDCVANKLHIQHNLETEDLMRVNPKLEELLAARVFDINNGLSKLSDDEKNKYKSFWTDDNPNDDAYLPWLNSQLPPHLKIGNLYRDLSDGIILAHILERSQRGVINWKRMRKQIRHKFDKVANCNYVYDVMKQKFPFSLVGIAGPDIVDGQQKYIHTILWQIMRYQATKKLSELSFGGKEVTDNDILKWSKETHAKLANPRSKTASGFRDRVLTTCVFYLELMKVLTEGDDTVRDDLVNYEVPPLESQSDDNMMTERMANARYAISLIRMHGGDVFILPEDLVTMDQKAVLSVYAAIMTVDYERRTKPVNSNQYNPDASLADLEKAEQAVYGSGGFEG
eukprot:CAMPEP_0202688196 /NCGR_PEP_ID=MMETSP1385-20130828/3723_1 /ASSEMBLY_ACC=CAM_ASM_000861 /TAXON_ID=933848 /ORGANISM="Elphidium margaritaceum" /LENGTH=934 /DNA_ID=CAMNT_0049343105 /DNA_START=25 /DNA_END=2829 /DNA_ORIENTATION=+